MPAVGSETGLHECHNQALVRAYVETEYRIGVAPMQVSARVGVRNPALDQFLTANHAGSGVVITACNAEGRLSGVAVNARANERLASALRRDEYRSLPHLAVASVPEWNEDGFFVLDMEPDRALYLAEEYGQYAVLHYRVEAEPRLLFTRLMPLEGR